MELRFSRLYFLQSYFKEDDPQSAILFFIVAGSVLVIFIIVRFIMHIAGIPSPGSGYREPHGFSRFALRRTVRSYGLNRKQIKMLELVLKNNEATNPERVISNPELLDNCFRRTYRTLKRQENEDETQVQIGCLFSTRNAIEFAQSALFNGPPPRITAGMAAVLAAGGTSYPVKILSIRGDDITIACPTNALGTPIKVSKNAKITLSFFTRTNSGFIIESQLKELTSKPSGPVLELIRASRPKGLVQRRFKRQKVGIFCYVRPVKVEETGRGRRKQVRMIVDRRRFTGTMQDISIGGCAMKTNAAITAGSRVKIEFNYGGSEGVAVLGQVLRFNRNGINTVMHTKFLKVPRKAMNAINVVVFNYLED
jgi:hypothetical protein